MLPERPLERHADLCTLPGRGRRDVADVVRLAGASPHRHALNLLLWRGGHAHQGRPRRRAALLGAPLDQRPDNLAARRRMLGHLPRP